MGVNNNVWDPIRTRCTRGPYSHKKQWTTRRTNLPSADSSIRVDRNTPCEDIASWHNNVPSQEQKQNSHDRTYNGRVVNHACVNNRDERILEATQTTITGRVVAGAEGLILHHMSDIHSDELVPDAPCAASRVGVFRSWI